MAGAALKLRPRRLLEAVVGPFGEVVEDGARDRSYRTRVVIVLALVIALDYADRSAVGALGPDLERAFHISNTKFGLLASAFSLVGTAATLPAGFLADRMRRTLLLAVAVALWCVAMGATGAATTFLFLIAARTFLGLVTATARPVLISITGDTFPAGVRGRALGMINSGELVGDGIGFLLAGAIAAFVSWRGVFWALGAAGIALVVWLARLPEPPRTGRDGEAPQGDRDDPAEEAVEEDDDVQADEELVLEGDQEKRGVLDSFRYVLRVRTQLLVIVAIAVASFFFAGLRTFIIVFAVKQYGVGRSVADIALLVSGIGAVAGILAGGRIGDWLIGRGHVNGRLVVSSWSYVVVVLALVPAFLLGSLWLALPLYVLGAAALSAPIATLDAVRLDVIHPQLWGRAEGVRTLLLIVGEAGGPLLFGLLADRIAGGGAAGLRWTFLGALSTLLVSAVCLQVARRFYPQEVAAAHESVERGD